MARIGFIGLGNMGLPMAQNLIKAGHTVTSYDVNPAVVARFAETGGNAAADIGQAAADNAVVVTMLPAGEHVRGVYLNPDGILARAAPGTLLIDCSTIDVATAREVAEVAAGKGL